MPVVLFGREYWNTIINFRALLAEGVISPGDRQLFNFTDEPEEAWEILGRESLNAHLPCEAMLSMSRGHSDCNAKIHSKDKSHDNGQLCQRVVANCGNSQMLALAA